MTVDKNFNRKNFDETKELNCLFCGDESDKNMLFSKCNHAIVSCQDCVTCLENKECVVCRSKNNKIKKNYLSSNSF